MLLSLRDVTYLFSEHCLASPPPVISMSNDSLLHRLYLAAESENDVVLGVKLALDNQLKTAFHGSGDQANTALVSPWCCAVNLR